LQRLPSVVTVTVGRGATDLLYLHVLTGSTTDRQTTDNTTWRLVKDQSKKRCYIMSACSTHTTWNFY